MNDILTGIPVAEGVIPESVETFSEAASYVIENTQNEFKELLEEEGIVDENGQLIVNENAEGEEDVVTEGVGEFKDRFVEVLQSTWSSIKAWFEKVIKWFKEKAAKAKEFLDAQIDKVKEKLDDMRKDRLIKKFDSIKLGDLKLKKTDKLGKTHKFNFVGKLVTVSSKGVNDVTGASGNSVKDIAKFKENLKDIVDKIPGAMAGSSDKISVGDMKRAIKKTIVGEEIEYTGANFSDNEFSRFKDIVINNSTQKIIKESYNEARKTIKDSISAVKKASKKDKAVVAATVSALKTINMILHAAHGVTMDACKQRYNEYMRILNAVARISGRVERERKRKERQKSKKANASTEFESLFDF